MDIILQSSIANRLFASLPKKDFALLASNLQSVELEVRDILYEPSQTIEYAYFPTSGICSVIADNAVGVRYETGIVGKEGFIGIAMVLHEESARSHVVVQVAGRALRIARKALENAMTNGPILFATLQHFSHVFGVQTAQTAVTNGRNTISQRLARWILMCQDRADAPEFALTHEFLAVMLAVRRSGVTKALHDLQARKLIQSTRGRIAILNRTGLLEIAGGAYGVPEREYGLFVT